MESPAVTTIVESACEAAAMKAASAETAASKAAAVEAAAAKATAMAASAAKAAATAVAASASASASASTSTAARQRHRWRNQTQGGNRQQRDQTLAHHNHSPSDLAPNRDTSDVAIVFEIAIAIDAFAAQLFAMSG